MAGWWPRVCAAVNSRLEETSFRTGMAAAVMTGALAMTVAGLLVLLSGSAPASVPVSQAVVLPTIGAPAAAATAVPAVAMSGQDSGTASLPSAAPVLPPAASAAGQPNGPPGQPASAWRTDGSAAQPGTPFRHRHWRRHWTGWYGTRGQWGGPR